MKAVGLIVEYNPFHNGHSHHLLAAKERTQADIVIAVMSGNFLQRGEPALVSKWHRTKMALLGGVDIVVELPYAFATQKAETFANGAVSILNAIGCEALCFGSENGDILSFYNTIEFLKKHQNTFEENIRNHIKTGVSYPKALSLSFEQMNHSDNLVDLSAPNNILGFHYMKAIVTQKSAMKPITIKRKNASYHDEYFTSDQIASATSIRKALFSTDTEKASIDPYVPDSTNHLLKEYYMQYGIFHQWDDYWPMLQFRLLQCEPTELREIYEVEEGLENRLINAALKATCFQDFMQELKTKRYTWTRLQRVCTHIITNAKKSQMSTDKIKATYLRLLGMTENGKKYLNKKKSYFSLPLISKLSSCKQEDILLDIKAARIYSSILPNHSKEAIFHQEYTQTPIYIK